MSKSQSSDTYQVPQEVIDQILAQAGLESLSGNVEPLDDNVSQR